MVKLNQASIDLLKQNEGLRLTAYYDTVGVITIGYGSARTFRGRPIYEGMTITEEEAELALQEDIERYQTFLTFFKRDFNANQIGALTSFEYNLGGGIWVNDGWNPNYSDAEILASMNNYRNPPEISSRRDREIAFYQTTPTDGDDSNYGGEPPNPDPPIPPEDGNKDDAVSKITESMSKFFDKVVEFLEDFLTNDVHALSQGQFYANKYAKVTRTYSNTLRVQLLPNLTDTLKDMLTLENTDQTPPPPKEPNPPTEPSSPPPQDNELMQRIYNWANDRQGQSFDFDGVWGAQCVDLITWINGEMNLGLNLAGAYAKDIYNNALPSTWERVVGDPNDDNASAVVWNTLPNGAIVWFTNSGAGHVGIKAGDWCLTLNQNMSAPYEGGPIVKTENSAWLASGGTGFLGAWVFKG